jgi:hypothetical protein
MRDSKRSCETCKNNSICRIIIVADTFAAHACDFAGTRMTTKQLKEYIAEQCRRYVSM